MAQTVVRKCRNPKCGKEFPSKTSRALYCSPDCNRQFHRDKQSTTLTFVIGNVSIMINDISPDADREALQRGIINSLPAELIKKAHLIELPEGEAPVHVVAGPAIPDESPTRVVDEAFEDRFPVQIRYVDGFVQQANISRSELATIVGSQRMVGTTLRTVADVN